MQCVTDGESFLLPSFFSAHGEWNLNKVGQQQPMSNKTANILVKSSMSASPFSPSLREDSHGCGDLVPTSSSDTGAISKASKMRFDDIGKVGCTGRWACKLGIWLLNATLGLSSSVWREVFRKTQAENQARWRMRFTLRPFPHALSVSGIVDICGYQRTGYGLAQSHEIIGRGLSTVLFLERNPFASVKITQWRLGISFMNHDFSTTSKLIFSCLLRVLCQLLYRE